MSAQLELPEEFTLPASAGEREKELSFRRDRELGGVTYRARIGPLISTLTLTVPSAAKHLSSSVSSKPRNLGESEEEMSPSKNDGKILIKGELFRRTLPFALFLVLALVSVAVDRLSPTLRLIFVVFGILLVAYTFYLWFPRDGEPRGKAGLWRQKL